MDSNAGKYKGPEHDGPRYSNRISDIYHSPVKLLLIIAGSIFVTEFLIMLFLFAFTSLAGWGETPLGNMILDATLLVILLSPVLYYFLFRPLIRLVKELESAVAKIDTLSGLLPICSYCKKIRDDKGYWNKIETYISQHSRAEFSHGICPECGKKALEEFNSSNAGKKGV